IAGVAGWAEDGSKVVYVDRIDEEARARLAQLWTDGYQLRITTTLRLKEATHVFLGEKLPKRLALALGKPIASSYLPHKGELDTQVSRLPDVAPIGDLNPVWTLNLDTQLLQHSSAAREDLTQPSPEIELKESHQPVSATTKALLQASSNQMIETAPPPTGYEDIAAFSAAPSSRGDEQHASAADSSYDLNDA